MCKEGVIYVNLLIIYFPLTYKYLKWNTFYTCLKRSFNPKKINFPVGLNPIKYIIPEIGVSDISYHKRRRKANNTVFVIRSVHFVDSTGKW